VTVPLVPTNLGGNEVVSTLWLFIEPYQTARKRMQNVQDDFLTQSGSGSDFRVKRGAETLFHMITVLET
jgi:hypothetical protein